MNQLPTRTVSARLAHHGRAQEGLNPETVTPEQLQLAAELLYRAHFGHGVISRGEIFPHVGKAIVPPTLLRVEDRGDRHHLFADLKAGDSTREDVLATGMFLGQLELLNKSSCEWLVLGAGAERSRGLSFKSAKQMAKALNKMAKEMGNVALLRDPSARRPALELLGEINEMHGPARD